VLGYALLGLDTSQISKMDFERISVQLWWHLVAALPSKKNDITVIWELRKALIRWCYNRF
jgi:hypothetical protein